ncbi:MAG: EscU/YscU/HrcU family type III secretion system export apparatus switch protein [Lachnospiraceae bacterium]|nr:EscU/YscU/HrcU family type III secretion system export apparatus switch protein [Lachnospiraceae bacterium]
MAQEENKKVKTAVAIEYDPNDMAPKIVATGRGKVAERIIEQARENDVPVHEDEKLANTLSKLDIGEYIPPELYEVVAEILVFVDNMEKIRSKLGR